MDPLSVSTGILTLLGACSTISSTLSHIRQCRYIPDILTALHNEVSDLRLVLLDIHDHREEFLKNDFSLLSTREKRLLESCYSTLERTWNRINEAEPLLRDSVRRI